MPQYLTVSQQPDLGLLSASGCSEGHSEVVWLCACMCGEGVAGFQKPAHFSELSHRELGALAAETGRRASSCPVASAPEEVPGHKSLCLWNDWSWEAGEAI